MDTEQAQSLPYVVRKLNGRATYPQLYKAIKEGVLKATQPGGKGKHHRVRLSDVERFLASPGRQ